MEKIRYSFICWIVGHEVPLDAIKELNYPFIEDNTLITCKRCGFVRNVKQFPALK